MARTPIGVPLVRLAAIAFVACVSIVTINQCVSAYVFSDAAAFPRRCVADALAQWNNPSWLHEGSLLGAARLQSILPLDTEFDVAVAASVAEVRALVERLETACGMTSFDPNAMWSWTLGKAGTLFRFTRWEPTEGDGELSHADAATLAKDAVLPTKRCVVGSAEFQCPRDSESLLRNDYGAQWRTAPLASIL